MRGERPRVSPTRRYSESETAEILGVNRKTLKRWRDSKQIKFIRSENAKRVYYVGLEVLKAWATR